MKRTIALVSLLAVSLVLGAGKAGAAGIADGINSASLIDFPTAMDQNRRHLFHISIDMININDVDLRMANFRYGLQFGNFQLVNDVHFDTFPERNFRYAESRAKLRVLPLDDLRTDISAGILGRYSDTSAGSATFNDKGASLFVITTSQVFLMGKRPMMVNFYLDNLYASLGIKLQAYQFIKGVLETDYLHGIETATEKGFSKLGVEIEGEQNFYFQLYYSTRTENLMFQMGSGF